MSAPATSPSSTKADMSAALSGALGASVITKVHARQIYDSRG